MQEILHEIQKPVDIYSCNKNNLNTKNFKIKLEILNVFLKCKAELLEKAI